MKTTIILSTILIVLIGLLFYQRSLSVELPPVPSIMSQKIEPEHWLLLHRKSNKEFLYLGIPGKEEISQLVKTFDVKSGIPNQRPTPLPKLLGREYWLITEKLETPESLETAPYFLTLDIPVTDSEPFGPTPYTECLDPESGQEIQCNWIIPGSFGLHGVSGDDSKLSVDDPGSSGCVRHSDEDITYLYNLLEPQNQPTKYFIVDL